MCHIRILCVRTCNLRDNEWNESKKFIFRNLRSSRVESSFQRLSLFSILFLFAIRGRAMLQDATSPFCLLFNWDMQLNDTRRRATLRHPAKSYRWFANKFASLCIPLDATLRRHFQQRSSKMET